MSGTDTGSATDGVGNVFDAVDAFDTYLNPPKEDKQGDESEQEQQAINPATSGEDEPDAKADESEQSDESEVDGEEQDDEQQPAPRTYTVRVDGHDEQVAESELIAGYQRQSDYTKKTQALANERRTFEGEKQTVSQERAEYAALLPKLREALSQGLEREPDWEALRAKDPAQAAVEHQRWQERKARVAAVQAEEQRLFEQQRAENERLAQQIIREESEKALKLMPHWKGEDAKKRDVDSIKTMMLGLGFAENETTIYDARALYIAHLASKYLEIQKQKPELKAKIAAAPVAKPGNPNKVRPQTEHQKAQQRLARTGSVKDAAKAFEAFID